MRTMFAESHDEEQIISRVAALNIGKAELVCCVRVPAENGPGKRLQELSTHSTVTRSLTELANHLVEFRVERVVMRRRRDYWKPVFYLVEAHGLAPWLVNARDVKHLPGRPKTCGRGLVVQGRRTADVASEFRTATADPKAT